MITFFSFTKDACNLLDSRVLVSKMWHSLSGLSPCLHGGIGECLSSLNEYFDLYDKYTDKPNKNLLRLSKITISKKIKILFLVKLLFSSRTRWCFNFFFHWKLIKNFIFNYIFNFYSIFMSLWYSQCLLRFNKTHNCINFNEEKVLN